MTDRWVAVATLTDASRRALFDYVRRQRRPVHREEAAAATAMSRGLAAFHLDKLVDAGLLTARYEAPAGRPRGRGRTPKVYEPAGTDLAILIPQRRYELIADILAEAADGGRPAAGVARKHGHDLGERLRAGTTSIVDVLADLGFEPAEQEAGVVLRNCPFHALAQRHTALVCGLNHAFLGGLLDGLRADDMRAVLAPRPPACCVELSRRAGTPTPGGAASP